MAVATGKIFWVVVSMFVSLVVCGGFTQSVLASQQLVVPTKDFKVAFIGDQEANQHASYPVLRMIRQEGADLVVVLGDFDYKDNPRAWGAMMTSELTNYGIPYVVTVGNHDIPKWKEYQRIVTNQLAKYPEIQCEGDHGVKSVCVFRGVAFVLSGIGTYGDYENNTGEYVDDLIQKLDAKDNYVWKICGWHKNHTEMQVGGKKMEVPILAYEICRIRGAMIMTAHEHSYSRSRTLMDMREMVVDARFSHNAVGVGHGMTFVVVSGLGGAGPRIQARCLPAVFPYGCNNMWAHLLTTTQEKNLTGSNTFTAYGALFMKFRATGNVRVAEGYFRTISTVPQLVQPDTFTVTSYNAPHLNPPQPQPTATPIPIATPIQINKSCTVQLSASTVTTDQRVTIQLTGTSTRNTAESVGLLIKRSNNGSISPKPVGTTEQIYSDRYYYKFSTDPCTARAGVGCSTQVQIPALPVGTYQVYCEMLQSPQCTGNPNCDVNGGASACSASGTASCSNQDFANFIVEAVRKPGDVNRDGRVDITDFALIIQNFGRNNCTVNLVGSCMIDIFDYQQVIAHFGR